MDSARDELARILHERGGCSVAELAEAMGVSPGSVRHHLDILGGEGLIEARREHRPRGRPLAVYSLSEAGEERSAAAHYARLLGHVYPALTALDAGEVAGRDGAAILRRVFEGVAERVAGDHAPYVRGETLPDRIGEVVAALSGIGVLHDAADEGDAYRLGNVGCPCRAAALDTDAACEADRQSIELLLGAPVEQVATIAKGADCCEYLVRKPLAAAAGGTSAEARERTRAELL